MHSLPYHKRITTQIFGEFPEEEHSLSELEKIDNAMKRALEFPLKINMKV